MSRTVTTLLVVVLVATVGAASAAADSTNGPPTVDAGDDRTVDEGTTVRLDASDSTDPDGDVVTHAWRQTAGPSVTLSNRYATEPNFTAPAVESETTLTFEVTARDGNGGTDTDTVAVTVVPTNDPPTADAGADVRVESTTRVELDAGDSTDSNGDALSYSWRQVAGGSVTLVDTGPATASFTALPVDSPVPLVFEVTATDADGANDTDRVEVTVVPAETSTYTRDELAQAVYGYDFDDLSAESAREIEELYLRQPFSGAIDPADLQTREALARERYGRSFDDLDRTATVDVQSAYDAQFEVEADDDGAVAYTRDDISQAKYDYDFGDLSTETSGEVQELYDRQPFAASSPGEVRTRAELSVATYGVGYADLSRESRLTIERLYDAQFGVSDSTANFSVTALSASAGDEGPRVTARITNRGSAAATQSVDLRLDRDDDGAVDDVVANRSLALDPGATARVNFTVAADLFGPGRADYAVTTANDSRRATLDPETLTTASADDPYDDGADAENATADDGRDGPVAAPERREGETVVDLSTLRANHRYEVDLGDAVTANGVTLTGQELVLVRSDDGGSLRVAASETTMGDAPGLTGTFAYLRVESDGLADEDIREVDFVFRVSPSRLDATGVDPNEVELYRYHDGEWESYETVYRGDGRFESGDVPGFSVFAVAPSDASVTTPTPTATETPTTETPTTETPTTETTTPAATETPTTETTAASAADTTPTATDAETTTARQTTSSRAPGFTVISVLAALVVGALGLRRRHGQR